MKKNSFFLFLFILFHLSLFAKQVFTIAKKFRDINQSVLQTKKTDANRILNYQRGLESNGLTGDVDKDTLTIKKRTSVEINPVQKDLDRSSAIQLIRYNQIQGYEYGKFIPGQSVLGN